MDDLTHNAWATPHDLARQRVEQAKRQEALAREAAQQAQNQHLYQHQQQHREVDNLTAQMSGLGYGQSTPQPEQLRMATELRQMQRRLHDAEQALAAERALHHQQEQHFPPVPPPPPPVPPQSSGPSWGNNDQPAYHAYGTDFSDKFADWERKEELKAHRIELFDGKSVLEGLQKWFRSVEHYGRLAGYADADNTWEPYTNLTRFGSGSKAIFMEFVNGANDQRLRQLLPKAYGGTGRRRRRA